MVKKADYSSIPDNQIPFLAVEPESYKVFLDPKLYTDDNEGIPKHDVTYSGKVEVIFRPKTDTSVISLHIGLLQLEGDPMLKRRLSMDTPTEQVLKVSVPANNQSALWSWLTHSSTPFIYYDVSRVLQPAVFVLGNTLFAHI